MVLVNLIHLISLARQIVVNTFWSRYIKSRVLDFKLPQLRYFLRILRGYFCTVKKILFTPQENSITMKKIKNYFLSLCLVIAMPPAAAIAQDNFTAVENQNEEETASLKAAAANLHHRALTDLNLTIAIPASLQSQIERTDYENESIFSLKTGDKATEFLFSVTKVSVEQWMKVREQLKGYRIIENQSGFITVVQKTSVKKIQGPADAPYQQALRELDAMLASIRIK